jgi:hypothetical protein
MVQDEIKEMADETILPRPVENEKLPEETNENSTTDPPLPRALIEWLTMINRRWLTLQKEGESSVYDQDER